MWSQQPVYDEPPNEFPPPPPPISILNAYDDDDEFDDDSEEEDPYEEVGIRRALREIPIEGFVDHTYEVGSKGRGPGQFGGWIQHYTVSDDGQTLYACDVFNERIQIISLPDRKYKHSFNTNIAQYKFQARGIAMLRGGNICVNCVGFDGTSRIGIFTPEGRNVHNFGQGIFGASSAMTVDSMDKISVIDRRRMKVITVAKDGNVLGSFDNPVRKDSLRLCANSKGDLIIPDHLNNILFHCDENGTIISRIVPPGGSRASFLYPAGVAVDCNDNILVCDAGNHCVSKFGPEGTFCRKILTRAEHRLWRPHDICTSKQGHILVSEVGKTYLKVMKFLA